MFLVLLVPLPQPTPFCLLLRFLPTLSMSMSMPHTTSILDDTGTKINGDDHNPEPPVVIPETNVPVTDDKEDASEPDDYSGLGSSSEAKSSNGDGASNSAEGAGPSVEQAQSADNSSRGTDGSGSKTRVVTIALTVAIVAAVGSVAAVLLYRHRGGWISSSGSLVSGSLVSESEVVV
mmetsp:Transcript_6450/g.13428  ORF Transcript_6450/g.13428 Transcript_6450/m.13428 type:complete len:177 (-) Transcript_6450:116-646(-)